MGPRASCHSSRPLTATTPDDVTSTFAREQLPPTPHNYPGSRYKRCAPLLASPRVVHSWHSKHPSQGPDRATKTHSYAGTMCKCANPPNGTCPYPGRALTGACNQLAVAHRFTLLRQPTATVTPGRGQKTEPHRKHARAVPKSPCANLLANTQPRHAPPVARHTAPGSGSSSLPRRARCR